MSQANETVLQIVPAPKRRDEIISQDVLASSNNLKKLTREKTT